MFTRKRMVPLALAISALVVLAVASLANAAHMRPKAAGTIRVSLVPAFNVSDNTSTHGPPLGAASDLTPTASGLGAATGGGTPATDGAANMDNSYVRLKVFEGVAGPPDTSDVLITSEITDVRCAVGAGAGACGPANAVGRPDYIGELQGAATIRITDHYNGPPGFTSAGTVTDLPFAVKYTATGPVCVDPGTAAGSTCTTSTSANAAVPAAVKTAKRAVVETNTINIFDGGADGSLTTGTPATSKFATQGIFIP